MKALNLPILEQVIHVPRDRVESAREELESIGTQLRDCERFQRAVIDGCLMALSVYGPTRPCMEAIVIHGMQIGMAYAKAEREVAELEEIK
ncbi:hypothetical protein LCGC14_1660450 [marine sediment metagenome]|uniref:Uncharacterized protein n=1 Tax=marine sediment metagenome TaxID=412755 RepID=A0A0F9KUC4_9ZZZZ